MASSTAHTPPALEAKPPKGILKHSARSGRSPPLPPTTTKDPEENGHQLTEKERTVHNTQINTGHRRSSSAARTASRRQSSRTPSHNGETDAEYSQRLKWDEANLYLTEQERTATMKIDEPKTPYVKHYDPSEDPSDDDDNNEPGDIPGLSLGEPEEEVPEGEFERRPSKVHVDDTSSTHDDDELAGLSAEEREKHHRFEQLRKKHYEMKNVAKFLGHPEELDDLADDGDTGEDGGGGSKTVPPVPPLPASKSS